MSIEVTSSAFEAGGAIPQRYTGEGQETSPALNWSGLPEGTREVALICDDPDAPTFEPFVHWVVYKIPADRSGLPGGSAGGTLEGENDFGGTGYGGPMPPPPEGHGVHRYRFRVYALDTELEAGTGLSKNELLRAMEGHVLAEGELVGSYERR